MGCAAVHLRVRECEAGGPATLPGDVVAGEVGDLLDGAAEAGRADERAVGTRQAAVRDHLPTGMLEVVVEQIADAIRVEGSRSRRAGLSHTGVHGALEVAGDGPHAVGLVCRAGREQPCGVEGVQNLAAPLRTDLDGEPIAGFGERQIEAVGRGGPALHRVAEAGGGRAAAVDCHDEELLTSRLIRDIDMGAVQKNSVLHAECRQIAGPHADYGERLLFLGERCLPPGAILPHQPLDRLTRGKQKILEGVRPDDVVEPAGGLVAPQPVVAAILLVEPAGGELVHIGEVAVDHSPVCHLRTHDPMPPGRQCIDQGLQCRPCQPGQGVDGGRAGEHWGDRCGLWNPSAHRPAA